MFFKKKEKQQSATAVLLYEAYKRARENGSNVFYYALFDSEKKFATEFCRKNKLKMVLDHTTDGNLIYKFIIPNE